jgi:hypothetical protein
MVVMRWRGDLECSSLSRTTCASRMESVGIGDLLERGIHQCASRTALVRICDLVERGVH